MTVHPDKTAIRAVDACGGTYSAEEIASGFAAGHTAALTEAMKAVVDADALTAELFKVADNLIGHYENVPQDELFRTLPNHVAWAVVNGRAAVAKATGVSA